MHPIIIIIILLCLIYLLFIHPIWLVKKRWHTNKAVAVAYALILTVIVAIFIPLSMQNFFRYNYKAKRSEAKFDLHDIYKLQQEYYSKNNRYAQNLSILGFKPRKSAPRYVYTLNNKKMESVDIEIPKNGYIAFAEGNLDNDPVMDIVVINHRNRLINAVDDFNDLKAHNIQFLLRMSDKEFKARNKEIMPVVVIFLILLFYIAEPLVSYMRKKHSKDSC